MPTIGRLRRAEMDFWASRTNTGGLWWCWRPESTDQPARIHVLPAAEVTGPYHDGKLLLEGGGTSFLRTEGRFIGPGHAGIALIEDGR